MNKYKTTILLAALLVLTSGCDFFENNNSSGSGPISPIAETYTATVTSVEVANKDSGEILTVEGFPVQGGELIKE